MDEQEIIGFVGRAYSGDYPVFVCYPYSMAICADPDELGCQFARFMDEQGVSPDEDALSDMFRLFLADRCRMTFREAHELEWTSLFPWSIPEASCRFEVPYAIQCGAGWQVFDDMPEWLDHLEACHSLAATHPTFAEFARSMGVRLLSDR